MKKTIAMLGLAAVATTLGSSSAHADGYAASIGARVNVDLSRCPVSAVSRVCSATQLPVLSTAQSLTPCVASIANTTRGGAQEGLCSFADNYGRAGTLVAQVTNSRCDSFTISGSAPSTSLSFTDPTGVRWSIADFRLKAFQYQALAQDTWIIDPGSSWLRLSGPNGRVMALWIGGTARSNSRCNGGVPAANIELELGAAGAGL